MNGEELKERMEAGGIVYGTMLSMSSNPRWATPMSGFGLDYVVIGSPLQALDDIGFICPYR